MLDRRLAPSLFLVAALACALHAQTPPVTRDPRALALAAKALVAISAAPLQSLALTGSVTRRAGSEQTGTFQLEANARGQSRLELSLGSGNLVQVRDGSGPVPQGQWARSDGKAHAVALHNLWAAPLWPLPALGALHRLAADTSISVGFAGAETHAGVATEHVWFAPAGPTPLAARLGRVDFYLDATTLLPRYLDFDSHPDNALNIDLPVEVVFSDYQRVQGVLIPFHIQRYLRQTLVLDLRVSDADINPSLSSGDFHLQVGQ